MRYASRKSTVNKFFDVEPDKTKMRAFSNPYKPKALNKKPTCFKNVDKPSCTDLLLTNSSKCVEHCLLLETDLLDFHNFIVNVMKMKHERLLWKIIKYRDYKKFDTKVFEKRL